MKVIYLACAFVLNSCTVNKIVLTMKRVKFDKQGHRGCRGLMPENTIPAMLYAIDLDVTTLEMDVHITKDSQVVVSHDPWFNRDITTKPGGGFITAGEPKYILYSMNYADIARFDVGLKSYSSFPQQLKIAATKPLLSALVDSVEAYAKQKKKSISYNIEIKSAAEGDNIYHPEPGKFAELLMKVLQQKQINERVIIQSFDVRPLKYLHLHYPKMKMALLVDVTDKRSLKEHTDDLGFTPIVYSPHYLLVTTELLKACHEQHLKVIPWTVNDLQKMRELKGMGVDGLISDYPNLYKQL